MTALSLALVLVSAALHVGWNAIAKSSRDPVIFMALKGVWLLGLGAPLLLTMPLSALPGHAWEMAFYSGVIHAMYALSLGRAYRSGDISYVYPIARSAPALIPFAAYAALGERLAPQGVLAVGMVVVGVLWMQTAGLPGGLRSVAHGLRSPTGFWAAATLLSTVAYSIVDKAGMQAMAQAEVIDAVWRGPLYFVLENTVAYAIYLAVLLLRAPGALLRMLPAEGSRALWAAVGTLLSYSLILHVLQTETLSYVVAARQSSVLLAPLVGWLVFREAQGRVRLLPATLIAAGVALVAL